MQGSLFITEVQRVRENSVRVIKPFNGIAFRRQNIAVCSQRQHVCGPEQSALTALWDGGKVLMVFAQNKAAEFLFALIAN